jgi:hypothetical protein
VGQPLKAKRLRIFQFRNVHRQLYGGIKNLKKALAFLPKNSNALWSC